MPESCVRGCTQFRQHLSSCFVEGRGDGAWVMFGLDEPGHDRLMDADLARTRSDADGQPAPDRSTVWIGRWGGLEVWQTCRGCLPRPAVEGSHLCESCSGRLTEWLRLLPWLYGWLDSNVALGGSSGAKQDWQRPGGSDGGALPLRPGVLDLRNLLTDRLVELEDCARDVFDRPARRRFTVATAVRFLLAWQSKIEGDLDLVVHAAELLEDLVRRARVLVPWEDRPRRIQGILCPQCNRQSLEVKPGMEDVTCRNCRAEIPRQRYDIWTRVLAEEARQGVS